MATTLAGKLLNRLQINSHTWTTTVRRPLTLPAPCTCCVKTQQEFHKVPAVGLSHISTQSGSSDGFCVPEWSSSHIYIFICIVIRLNLCSVQTLTPSISRHSLTEYRYLDRIYAPNKRLPHLRHVRILCDPGVSLTVLIAGWSFAVSLSYRE